MGSPFSDYTENQMRVGIAERTKVHLGAAPQLFDGTGYRHKVVTLLFFTLA